MFNKLFISIIIVASTFSMVNAAIADTYNGISRRYESTPVFELKKDLDNVKTFEKEQIIKAKSKEGTKVYIDLYWFKRTSEKSVVIKDKSRDNSGDSGEWVLENRSEHTVGASGIFARVITLKPGKNKIVINIVDTSGSRHTKEIQFELIDKSELTELLNNMILRNLEIEAR